jgi:hypothetical protein
VSEIRTWALEEDAVIGYQPPMKEHERVFVIELEPVLDLLEEANRVLSVEDNREIEALLRAHGRLK